jgi:hypothetical protein
MSAVPCAKCKQPLADEEVVIHKNIGYHAGCLLCSKCETRLKTPVTLLGSSFCAPCAKVEMVAIRTRKLNASDEAASPQTAKPVVRNTVAIGTSNRPQETYAAVPTTLQIKSNSAMLSTEEAKVPGYGEFVVAEHLA